MLALLDPDTSEGAMAADCDADPIAAVLPLPTVRHRYNPSPCRRWVALAGTSFTYALIPAGLFISFEAASAP